jgi:DNA-binding transcriptional MocR family regulator
MWSAVEQALRQQISRGRTGERLPSMRELQSRFAVSPVTVNRVIRQLVLEGLATTRPGDGTFIAGPRATGMSDGQTEWQRRVLGRTFPAASGLDHLVARRQQGVIDLRTAFPDPSLQCQPLLAKAARRVAGDSTSWDRCSPKGSESLRSLFAAELGTAFSADDVIVTSGAQAALDTICRTIGAPGDVILTEDPCYPGLKAAAANAGLRLIGVSTDRDGIVPAALEAALRKHRARLVAVQPRYANPTGSVLATDRRAAVIALAEGYGCFVVEDDWVRDLDLDGPTGPPLIGDDQHGHIIYVRSISKASAPGVRIAAMVARGPVFEHLATTRLSTDFFTSPVTQAVALQLLSSPSWQRHLAELRVALRLRRDTLCDAVVAHAPGVTIRRPAGGVAVCAELPSSVDEAALVAACAARGVLVSAGSDYRVSEPGPAFVRLAFPRDEIDSLSLAAERFGRALDDVTDRVR